MSRRGCRRYARSWSGDFRERRAERLRRFGVDARTERLDRAWFFGVCNGPMSQVRAEAEQIEGWRDDAQARSLRTVAGSPEYSADIGFVMDREPAWLLAYSNHAINLYQMRHRIGARHAAEALQDAIDHFVAAGPSDIPAAAVEGLLSLSDLRIRADISAAYVDLAGPARTARLRAVLLGQLYKCLGILLFEAGEWSHAHDRLSKAVETVSDDGYTYAYLARAANEMGRREAAIRHFRRGIALEPHFGEAYCGLSDLLLQSGRYAEAIDLLEQARLSYTYADASRMGVLVGLGAAYVGLGEKAKARGVLTQARAELDTGLIDMGSWQIQWTDGAIQPDQIARTRHAIQTLLEPVTA